MGQSVFTDLRWGMRFRSLRLRQIDWNDPSDADRSAWQGHPDLSRFGDFLVAVAEIDCRRCWIVERIWNGWPDPPRFAFFAMEPDGELWAAYDFHWWPNRWVKPAALSEQLA